MLRQRLASLFGREAEGVGWSVKKKKLFERSEFFFFRERVKNLAPERQPAVFLFCYLFSFCCQKEKSKSTHN